MTSPNVQQGQLEPAELLRQLGRIFFGIGKGVETMPDNRYNEVSGKILKAIENAASTSQDFSELPEKLRIALADANILVQESVEVEAVIEYASILQAMQIGKPDWKKQTGEI